MARQHDPVFSAEVSVDATLSQPGPVPNSGPGSWGLTCWPAGPHPRFAEQPCMGLPCSQLAECAECPGSQRRTAAPWGIPG